MDKNNRVKGVYQIPKSAYGIEKVSEDTMPENSQYLVKHINPQVEKAEWTPNKIKLKTSIPKYIIIKLLKAKDKEKFLKNREKWYITYREASIQMIANFWYENRELKKIGHFSHTETNELYTVSSIYS